MNVMMRLRPSSSKIKSYFTFRSAAELICTKRLSLCAAEDESRNFRTCPRAQSPPNKVKREGSIVKSEDEKSSCEHFTACGHFAAEHFPRPMQVSSARQCQS